MLDIEKNRRLTDQCAAELGFLQKRVAEINKALAQELLASIETGIPRKDVETLRFDRAQVEQETAGLLIVLRELKRRRKRLRAEDNRSGLLEHWSEPLTANTPK